MGVVITSAERRALVALGAFGFLAGSLAGNVRIAASDADPLAIHADRALSDITSLREVLNELELAVLCVRADASVARAA